MSITHIHLKNGKTTFFPGETIEGAAVWQVENEVDSAALRLFWYTEGKGTRDVRVVEEVKVTDQPPVGKIEFSFSAPALPPSYAGRLIAFIWSLELELRPRTEVARQRITISPTGSEL